MSASTERKNRLAEMEAGIYRKQTAQKEADQKKAKERRTTAICAAVVVVIVAAAILLNLIPDMKAKQELRQYTNGVAVTIGDRSYSPAEISYLYANQFSTLASNYYAQFYGLDTSKGAVGLGEQTYTGPVEEGKTIATWRDYILDTVYTQLKQTQVLLKYAKEQGISLTADEEKDIETDISSYRLYAAQYGYTDVDQFLSANLGKGVTIKTIERLERDSALAQKAYTAYQDSLSFTDAQLDEEYAAFHGERDTYSYAVYSASEVEAADGVEPKSKAEASAEVDAVIASYKDGGDVADLTERFSGYVEEELGKTVNTYTDSNGSYLPSLYGDWLRDESRQPGDVEKFANDEGSSYYAVLFLGRTDMNYPTVNVRHILIQAEKGEDGTWSDEALAAAKEKAESILAEFQAGDKSEESFAALAEQYSEDSGSNTNGGLYEEVYKGQMVSEFNDFCFAEGRKAGDVGIVYGTNGSYAGYHVIYFSGEGRLYSHVLAESSLLQKALTEFLGDESVVITRGAGEALVDPVTASVEATAAPQG